MRIQPQRRRFDRRFCAQFRVSQLTECVVEHIQTRCNTVLLMVNQCVGKQRICLGELDHEFNQNINNNISDQYVFVGLHIQPAAADGEY